jgi:hypothetical protein
MDGGIDIFDIKPQSNMTLEEKLLFNIYELLKGSTSKPMLSKHTVAIEKPTTTEQPKTFKCKHCGDMHDKIGLMKCGTKHKKERG